MYVDPDALADHARQIAREARAIADEADDIADDLRHEAETARRLGRLAAYTVDWGEYLVLVKQERRARRWSAAWLLFRLALARLLT